MANATVTNQRATVKRPARGHVIPQDAYGRPDYSKTRFNRCRHCLKPFRLPQVRSCCFTCITAAEKEAA